MRIQASEVIDHILFHFSKKDCFIRDNINETAEKAEQLILELIK